jgi:hypothetical protein
VHRKITILEVDGAAKVQRDIVHAPAPSKRGFLEHPYGPQVLNASFDEASLFLVERLHQRTTLES